MKLLLIFFLLIFAFFYLQVEARRRARDQDRHQSSCSMQSSSLSGIPPESYGHLVKKKNHTQTHKKSRFVIAVDRLCLQQRLLGSPSCSQCNGQSVRRVCPCVACIEPSFGIKVVCAVCAREFRSNVVQRKFPCVS